MRFKSSKVFLSNFLFAISLIIFPTKAYSQTAVLDVQTFMTKKKAFELFFPGADKVKREKNWVTPEQLKKVEEITLQEIDPSNRINFYVGRKGDSILGYAYLDHQIGKSFPITFMTVLNIDGTVRDVEILVYREPRGWEVRFPSFMDQFTGKNAESDFREINTITGATLSVNALRKGVARAAALYKVIYLEK
jgi:hypothetical protein